MKKITPYLLLALGFLACKKKDVVVLVPSMKDALKIDKIINDSTIVLSWKKYTGPGFKQYRLLRTAIYLKNDKFDVFQDIVLLDPDNNTTSFTEAKMPLAAEITYSLHIDGDKDEMPFAGRVTYQRPNSLLQCSPTDVLFSKELKSLYIIEQQKVHIVDYTTGRPVRSKEFPVSIGYCALGAYNGNSELYVPLSDGWIEVLDAASLELKDRIYVAGYGIGSVLALNGKVYASSSDRSFGGYSNCIKIFDRASKTLLGRTGYSDQTRLVALEGTAVEIIDLTINTMPVGLYYYSFTPDGNLLTKREDTYHGDFNMTASIVRSFPDGSRFITSGSGTIFNKSLVFDRYLKQQNGYTDSFTDFAFNNDGSIVYAANGPLKKIDIIRYPSTTNIGNYPTKYSPYKLFRDENTLISVGRVTPSQHSYIQIETIKL